MDFSRKGIKQIILLSILAIAVSSCSDVGSHIIDGANAPDGYWSGFGHGLIAPITSFLNMLDSSIEVYSSNNTGWAYKLGFGFGVIKPFEWLLYIFFKS